MKTELIKPIPEDKFCHVCGKESTPYPLCPDCFKLRDEGLIIKCDKCNIWHLKWSACNCLVNLSHNPVITPNPRKTLTCLICKQYSYGQHFCEDCTRKYKERSIDIRLKDLHFEKITDEYGNLDFKCFDGHKVRSRAEALIANFLFENKIRYIYEKAIYYKENNEDKTLHPDFYLPDFDTYIEYNELRKIEYVKRKFFAINQYRKLGKKIKVLNERSLENLDKSFRKFLTVKYIK